jgi:GTPase Era involved in 16S rRNA processing
MIAYQQQKQQVLQLFPSALSFAQSVENAEVEKRLKEAQEHLMQGKLVVVVCGEFRQGKSSLLNALLNETGLFPVDVDITTNLVSSITYGAAEKITVLLGERGQEKAHTIQREEIPDYVTEQRNPKNAQQARMLIIESSNEQLKDGLVLVDTPGVGSLNVQHTDITYAFIPNADVILFVSDARAPLSAKELEFVQMILRHCQNFLFVVSKIDTVENYQSVVESNREKLAQVMQRPAEQIPIIPVSSHLKLTHLKSQDAQDLQDSNFPELEQTLWTMLNEKRGHILLTRALIELGRSVAQMRGPMQAEWDVCSKQSREESDKTEMQLRKVQGRLQNLLDNNATWRTQLGYGLQDIRTQAQEGFRDGFAEVRRLAERYLDDARLLASPSQVVGLLEVDVDGLMSNLGKQLSQQSAQLHADIEATTGLGMNPFEVTDLVWDKKELGLLSDKKSNLWEKSLHVTRNSMFNSTAGSTLGALIGGMAGAVVGTLFGGVGALPGAIVGAKIGVGLGMIGGIATGAKQGVEQLREKDKVQVAKILRQFIDDSQRECEKTLNRALRELERSMQDELTGQIKREKDSCERTLRSVQEARKLSLEQAAQKSAQLQAPLRQLAQLHQRIESLLRATVEPQTPATTVRTPSAPQQEAPVGASSGGWADE